MPVARLLISSTLGPILSFLHFIHFLFLVILGFKGFLFLLFHINMLCDFLVCVVKGYWKNPEVEKDRHLTSMGGIDGALITVTHVEF